MDAHLKKNLSDAYRVLAHLGWDDHTYTHLSTRSGDGKAFYICPFGVLFHEVRPHNLLKVSFEGEILEGSEYQYNETAYIIHGNTYKKRQDLNAIFHIHTPAIVAVSACKKGLLPISQWALHFYGKIAYHFYNSLNLYQNQSDNILNDLGNKNILFLRNHGLITCGKTIHETMFYTYHIQKACETQCLTLAMNQELEMPPHDVCEQSTKDLLGFEKDLGMRDWLAWQRLIEQENIKKAA